MSVTRRVHFIRMGSPLILLFAFVSFGFAQSSLMTTYVGPSLPVSGSPALTQAIGGPVSVTPDGAGGFYVVSRSQNRVYRVTSGGALTLIAGTSYGFSGDGGPATLAQLASPSSVTMDSTGNLYIADAGNQRIRKITSKGVISTVTGTGVAGFSGDGGAATSAQVSNPNDVAVDALNNLYIADTNNYRVRKVSASGMISTVAGNGATGGNGLGGAATGAQIGPPYSVALDPSGNLYIGDGFGIQRVSSGIITKVVGVVLEQPPFLGIVCEFAGDGGPAISASVCFPRAMAFDAPGNLYIADQFNERIRKVSTDGTISTIAGQHLGFSGDGGLAVAASLYNPYGVAADTSGNIFIADTENNRIRKITPDGLINTVAGTGSTVFAGDGGPSTSAEIYAPFGVALDSGGNLYIADTGNYRVRKVTSDGIVTTVAGNGTQGFSGDGGPATAAELEGPSGVALDKSGNLYISDAGAVRKVTPGGTIQTIIGQGGLVCSTPSTALCIRSHGVTVDTLGNLYVAADSQVLKMTPDGTVTRVAGTGTPGFCGEGGPCGDSGPATSAHLDIPWGVAVDAAGNLYISDWGSVRIHKVTPDGTISTIAGTGASGFSDDGGPAATAQLYRPAGIALDALGNLYVADYLRIRKIASDGTISTAAGIAASCKGIGFPLGFQECSFGFSGDGGPATSAELYAPSGVAVDASGDLYIADSGNSRIRKVSYFTPAQPFSIASGGANHWTATSSLGSMTVGYVDVVPSGTASGAINGVALFSYRSNGVLVSEASVPASPLIQAGRIYAETTASVRTGIAMANPNNQSVTISFYFTDKNGVNFDTGTTILRANQQIAAFLDEPPFNGDATAESFTFTSLILCCRDRPSRFC